MADSLALLQRQAAFLLDQGRTKEAITVHRKLLHLQPKLADAWFNLGYLLKSEGQFEAALDAYASALTHGIQGPEEVHLNRAVIFSDHLRRDDEAERELAAAITLSPKYSPALLNLGNLHEERGNRSGAITCYQAILDLGENNHIYLDAMSRLAHLRSPETADDPLIKEMASAAAKAEPSESKANLLFSLGRAYDSMASYQAAFNAFDQANALVRQSGPAYNPAAVEAFTDSLIEASQRQEPRLDKFTKAAAPAPLFICGMFRSGSTLVEQILAAHPGVYAGGEIDFLPRLARARQSPSSGLQLITDLDADNMASSYLKNNELLFPDASDAVYLTDKRPDNFLHIGLIMAMFPRAKIIHSIRNPMDNGLSIFMQHLDPGIAPFANRLEDIGHYFGQYRRLMTHWKSKFGESILDFDYDKLVDEPTKSIGHLLDFLGLQWNDACLDFQRAGNTVKTASYWQVRRPLYKEASGRWRHYQSELKPLKMALESSGIPVK
jgi:lipoprotein NlpI